MASRRGYNSHSGCRLSADTRNRPNGEIKPNGLHLAAQSQLIRSAIFISAKKIEYDEVGGFNQSLRTDDAEMAGEPIAESRDHMAGGQEFEPFAPKAAPPVWVEKRWAHSLLRRIPPITCVIRKTSNSTWGNR